MRNVILLCIGVFSLMLFSFRFQEKITVTSDGNYYVPVSLAKTISEKDAKRLFQLTKSMAASETTVVHETVWTHKNSSMKTRGKVLTRSAAAAAETTLIHETIYKHKDAKVSREAAKYRTEITQIMSKYVH
jgi:hypothetical protein